MKFLWLMLFGFVGTMVNPSFWNVFLMSSTVGGPPTSISMGSVAVGSAIFVAVTSASGESNSVGTGGAVDSCAKVIEVGSMNVSAIAKILMCKILFFTIVMRDYFLGGTRIFCPFLIENGGFSRLSFASFFQAMFRSSAMLVIVSSSFTKYDLQLFLNFSLR